MNAEFHSVNQNNEVMTLEQFIVEGQTKAQVTTGELSSLLRDIGLAAKIINREVNKAGLVDILGITGKENVHGEAVKRLDIFAHQEMIAALSLGGESAILASEEEEDIIPVSATKGKYVVLFDPLDGSSNIDVNVTIGTIFSIYRRRGDSQDIADQRADALQPGDSQVAAGYVVYGSSTMLVYTTGDGVNGFTLDPSIGEFLLSHRDIRIPKKGKYYSCNQGYYHHWEEGLKHYVSYLQDTEKATNRPYSLRYIGTMVADVHRTLMYGGIFFYPGTISAPNGKLRLLYECNPMAFLIEQAGGRATDGKRRRILDIEPQELHQRVPIFLGSSEDVQLAEEFMAGDRQA